MQSQKRQNDFCLFPRQAIQYHSNPSLCPNHECWRSWSWTVLWRCTRPSRTKTKKKKDVLFFIGDWNAKVRSQEIPGVTGKFGLGVQNETEQRLTQFCQVNALVIANTLFQQHKRRLYTWTSPHGQYWNQIDYILCRRRWRSSKQSAKARPGADCGSYHELLIAKFRLKLKKVGKTTRQFRYDLYQISDSYTVEVTKRLKGLDLINRVPEEIRTEVHNIVQEVVIKTIPKKKNPQKANRSSEEALQMAEKRREVKVKGGKERYTDLNAEFQRIARRNQGLPSKWLVQRNTGKQ